MAVMQTVFSLQGARGFEADLLNASKEMRIEVDAACRVTAYTVKRLAKAEADTFRDRGDLANAIAAEVVKPMNYRVGILDTTITSRGGRNSAHLNPWVYGQWYEYDSFVNRNIRAHPFIRPAAESQEEPHVQRIDQALGRSLQVAA
jgi:hypothetical protein